MVLAKSVACLMVLSIFFQRLVLSLLSVSSFSFDAANLDSLAAKDSARRSSASDWLLGVRSVMFGCCWRKDLWIFVLQSLAVVSVAGLLGVWRFWMVSWLQKAHRVVSTGK